MKRSIITLILILCSMLATVVHAQTGETDTECDIILSEAQSAYEDGDLDAALDFATEAQITCTNDLFGYREAATLTLDIERDIAQRDIQNEIQSATPGLVNIGDYSIFMTCEGEGSPTIIFENGLGWNVDTWNDVYPTAAESTRVCRYDRLGVGYSDTVPDATPRSSLQQAHDLHAVLENGEIDGPYVLVGHSIAGYMLVSFTHLYPDEILGAVFVDASIPENMQGMLPSGPEAHVRGAERLDIRASYQELREGDAWDFGDRPIVVLISRHRFPPAQTEQWILSSGIHTRRSTNSQQIIAEESGHYIQNDQPELVLEAIEWVFAEIENAEPAE